MAVARDELWYWAAGGFLSYRRLIPVTHKLSPGKVTMWWTLGVETGAKQTQAKGHHRPLETEMTRGSFSLGRSRLCGHLDFRHLAPRIVRKWFLVLSQDRVNKDALSSMSPFTQRLSRPSFWNELALDQRTPAFPCLGSLALWCLQYTTG